ncbi:hypothetical protein [Streptomyces sp. NPDC048106]|uniref:hypothetical protein n=1 Tax=Streptomyces sp. NPDC048106 TaxID=3155750 RepID=UPI003453F1EB
MERFGVTVDGMAAGVGGSALEALMAEQVTTARAALLAARELPALTSADGRRLAGALVEIELLTAEAVLARGAGVLHGSVNPPLGRTLRVLARRY